MTAKIFFTTSIWARNHPARAATLAGWFQQGCTTGIAILLIPIVTSKLSSAEAGIWFTFQSVITLISLIDLGFGFAISRQAAFTLGTQKETSYDDFIPLAAGWSGVAQLFKLTRLLYLILAVAATCFALCFYEITSRVGNLFPSEITDIRWAWYAISCAAVMLISTNGSSSFLNGLGAVYQTRLLAALYQLIAGVGAIAAVFLDGGLLWMAISFASSSILYRLCIEVILHRYYPEIRLQIEIPPPKNSLKKLAKVALPVGGVNIFGSMIYTAQVPLLGILLGPEKVAPFYLAQKIGQSFNMVVMHVALPQLPFFTRLLGLGDLHGASLNMKKNIFYTTILALISSLLFFHLSPWMATVLLKKGGYVDTLTLGLLALDFSILAASVIWGHYVLASGRNPFVLSTILTGFTSLGLSILLVTELGIMGLPIATICAGILFNYRKNIIEGIKQYKRIR